jgi:hypothetical protein
MRRILAVVLVAAAVFVTAAPSTAAPSPTEKRLLKQVATLQKQVKKLQKDLTTTQRVVLGTIALTSCTIAATADAFQGTWTLFDQKNPATFGAQTPLNDNGLCQQIQIPRRQTLPPNTSVFSALYGAFTG